MRLRLLLPILVAVSTLVACGDDDDDVVADESTTTTAESTTTSEASSTTTVEESTVHVGPDGLVVTPSTALPFGTPQADVVDAVTGALGDPTDEGTQSECPGGPADYVRFGPTPSHLLVDFDETGLIGWNLGHESELTTADGIGIGSTKADLEAVYGPVDVDHESTLGLEFFVDGMNGLLEQDAPEGLITSLWAGNACVFR